MIINDDENKDFRVNPSFKKIASKPNKQIDYINISNGSVRNYGFKKVTKPTQSENFKNKLLNESFAQLMKLNEHFNSKKEHRQSIRDMNEAKRLKNQNLYHHEYERIKNYLDTTVIDPVEAGRLEKRKMEIKDMVRKPTKYDELIKNGNKHDELINGNK